MSKAALLLPMLQFSNSGRLGSKIIAECVTRIRSRK